jgi:hypothetical protein
VTRAEDGQSLNYATQFARDGYYVLPRVLADEIIHALCAAFEQLPPSDAVRRKQNIYGVRNLLETVPEICELATRPEVWQFVTPILGDNAFATRAILFNKTPDANWVLGWHQDSVISVAEPIETTGFSAWAKKAGVWQVQPPPEILARMLALRIHLDDCGGDHGALRVLPGSHRHGWVEDDLAEWKRRVPEVVCAVPRGGVVAMCPLILHASSRSSQPSQRRVIHIEYANAGLPNGLRWNRQIRPEFREADSCD